MDKIIIFDLDDTLIDTELLKQNLFAFLTDYGCKKKIVEYLYQKTKEKFFHISLDNYWQVVKDFLKSQNKIVDFKLVDFKNKLKGVELKLAGVEKILTFCQKNKKLNYYLLSVGDEKWQKTKLELSGLNKFFYNNVFYVKQSLDKDQVVKGFLSKNKQVILFNDKVGEFENVLSKNKSLKLFLRQKILTDNQQKQNYLNFKNKFKNQIELYTNLQQIDLNFI